MKTLSGRCIRPFSSAFAVMQTNVSCEHLIHCIAANRRVVKERNILFRINACKEKIDRYIKRNLAICQQTSRIYALLLLSRQGDYPAVIEAMLTDLQIDELSREIRALVQTDMQHYFGRFVPDIEEACTVNTRLFFPPAYISQVLQEYDNTFRFTKTMGRTVNKVCYKSLSQVKLPRGLQQLAGRVDFGDWLLNEFDCSPARQTERLQRQVHACLQGVLNQWAVQIKHQYHEAATQAFYRFYDEHIDRDIELALITKVKQVHWRRQKKRHSLYEVPCAV